MNREDKSRSSFPDLDLTKPVNTEDIMKNTKVSDCFGKMWDLREVECARCADRDICGIIFNENVIKPKEKEIQKKQGAKFLDLTDFESITEKLIFSFVESGVTTTSELISFVMAKAKTDDRKATIAFLQRFITSTDGINTKDKKVWLS